MTRDIDIVVSPEYYVSDEAVRSAISARSLCNLFSLSRLIKIDLMVRNPLTL